MKSSQSDYKKRGMLDMNLCNQLQEASYKELIDTLQSSHADWRTACIHLLSKNITLIHNSLMFYSNSLLKKKHFIQKLKYKPNYLNMGRYLKCVNI